MSQAAVLAVEHLHAGYYSGVPIVNDVSFVCSPGEMVCLVGPNGAGKSTVVRALVGLTGWRKGLIKIGNSDVSNVKTAEAISAGLSYVPQGHEVFGSMTVRENLLVGLHGRGGGSNRSRVDAVVERLPMLQEFIERRAAHLSGGQQQIVSLGRALVTHPTFLLVDEPTAGLSPAFSDVVFSVLAELIDQGVGILLVEQNARRALAASHRGIVLDLGEIVVSGQADELLNDQLVKDLYVGGGRRPQPMESP